MTSLLGRTVSAAVLVLFIIITRALLLYKLPKLTFQVMWAVVALRLLLPFSVPVFSGAAAGGPERVPTLPSLSAGEIGSRDMGDAAGAWEREAVGWQKAMSAIKAGLWKEGGETGEDHGSDVLWQAIQPVLRAVWGIGAGIVLFTFLISHIRARRLYAMAVPVGRPLPPVRFGRRVEVKVSDRILTPMTYGVFAPVILLPKITDWDNTRQLSMALWHEAVHIRRFDTAYKWVMAVSVALHWFNPLVWAMYVLANRDIELACDEAVIRHCGSGEKAEYALALLSFEERRKFSPMSSRFGGNVVKERIEAIMKLNKTSVASMALAIILVAGTTTVFAGYKENKDLPQSGKEMVTGDDRENQTAKGSQNPDNPKAGGEDNVKQYLCRQEFYTPGEFKDVVKQERGEIEAMVKDGSITREDADALIEVIDKKWEEIQNGGKIEKPSLVYYADGTPVINSKGEQLCAKASDIWRMNAELLARANQGAAPENTAVTVLREDTVITSDACLQEGSGNVAIAQTDFSWYTYEEYKAYAEGQKKAYHSMLGQWGFNLTDGWYEWDGAKIEDACRLLEAELEFIKNGGMISKPVEGMDGAILMMSGVLNISITCGKALALGGGQNNGDGVQAGMALYAEATTAEGGEFDKELLKAYEAFGVTADEGQECYFYNGKKIAGITDSTYFLLIDSPAKEEGGIFIKGVRENGELTGLEEITKEEFSKLSGLSID